MCVVRVSEDVEVQLPQASDKIVDAEGFVGDGFGVSGEGECRKGDDAEEKDNNGEAFHYFILLFFNLLIIINTIKNSQ